jgi:hypothetical protein
VSNYILIIYIIYSIHICNIIPVTGRVRPQVYETLRLRHFLDNRLTDGGEVVSLMRRPPFTARKIPGTDSYYRLSRPQGINSTGRIR